MNPRAALLMLALCCAATYAQTSIQATAGGDQLYDAYGLQAQYEWRHFSGWMGAGYNNGARFGGYLKVPLKSSHIGLGDQKIEVVLDTDEYGNHVLTGRGLSANRKTESASLHVFSGLLLQETTLPYMFTGLTSGTNFQYTPLGAVTYQHKLSTTLQMHSLMMVGDDGRKRLTSIESLGWRPSKAWMFAGAAGLGSGSRYLSGAGEYRRERFDLWSSYTVAGKSFHRQEQPYYSQELVGFNARLTMTPVKPLRLFAVHERSQSVLSGFPSLISTVDSASIATRAKGFQVSPSVSRVRVDGQSGQTYTGMFSVTRQILPRWTSFASYIYMDSPSFLNKDIVTINEFRISPRLTIRQDFDRMDGQNTYAFGGDWLSNRISFSIDQQVYMNSLAPAYGGKAFFQAWSFNIKLRSPHRTETTLNAVVTPDGKTYWGGYLSGLRYSTVGPDHSEDEPSLSRYIISGKVVDEKGNGVWGIAVRIGTELIFSDENGQFFLHVQNSKPVPLAVAASTSLQSAAWKLQTAPAIAHGRPEGSPADPVLIIVRTGP